MEVISNGKKLFDIQIFLLASSVTEEDKLLCQGITVLRINDKNSLRWNKCEKCLIKVQEKDW